jgi:ribonuclease-3
LDFFRFFLKTHKNDKEFVDFVKRIFGVRPKNLDLYKQAFVHKSILREDKTAAYKCNERLEFLGDAVLDNIVAEFLYTNFPKKDEGFLTQMKSRVVNGEQLNNLAVKLGLDKFTRFHQFGDSYPKSLYGDVMEALIGALYLDYGFERTKKVVLEKLVKPYLDLKKLETTNDDYKSRLIIWAQRRKKKISFEVLHERTIAGSKEFEIALKVDGEEIARSIASNKRQAEKDASAKAVKKLRISATNY